MNKTDAYHYRRNLPHWRVDGAVYFVTWRIQNGQAPLSANERDYIGSVLSHFDNTRYRLHAYVIMDDHIHVLVEPLGATKLQDMVHSWKSFSANHLQREYGRHGTIWHREYFDRIVRDAKEYGEKRDYILRNPFKRWPEMEQYDWLWALCSE